MDEQKNQPEKHQDFRKQGAANNGLIFRVLAIGIVLYWLMEIVMGYIKGGPDAPSLTLLLIAIVTMGGGSIFIGWLTYKTYKRQRQAAQMTEEEVQEMEALRAADEEEKPEE